MFWLIRLLILFFVISLSVYLYIDRHNNVLELRLNIPQEEKKLQELQAENDRLQFEIDHFESPLHLLELVKKPEFSHLKFPYRNEVVEVELP